MITIKKIELGYGAFLGDRLVAIEEKSVNYHYLINSVLRANRVIQELENYNV